MGAASAGKPVAGRHRILGVGRARISKGDPVAQSDEDAKQFGERARSESAPGGHPHLPLGSNAPIPVDVSGAEGEEEEEQVKRNAWPPFSHYFFAWLGTAEGKDIAEHVSGFLSALQKSALEKRHQLALVESVLKYVALLAILGTATVLQYHDKLSPVMVSLFSGTAGFLLGRQQSK